MNSNLIVLCVDDERDILSSLQLDLDCFSDIADIECFESAEEVSEFLESSEDLPIALLITDQMMPGQKGTDLLKELRLNSKFHLMKVMLLTGQATHADTIEAINTDRLNAYITKPWIKNDLLQKVKNLLTDYVIESDLDATPFMKKLDTVKLLQYKTDFSE